MQIENQKVKEKKWLIKSTPSDDKRSAVSEIAEALGLNPILAELLYSRGYTDPENARKFLYMESEMLCNPFLMKDMDRAVARIRMAIGNHEKITVYGDYDVDGVTAVCTLYLYLKSVGANVAYYIPKRSGEGYGVSLSAIDTIRENGSTLIVTVDTGITANEEVAYGKTIGVDFVVTDHHECRSDLPEAIAVVNPHRPDCPYPFKDLAGVGVVFKLICAFEEIRTGNSRAEVSKRIFDGYADLVSIGTIADVMPICEENRIIVKYGLGMMQNTKRVGLAALIEAASGASDGARNDRRVKKSTKITSSYIGYTLAPRINAAGRIREASLAVELFLAEDHAEAYRIACELCLANKERQNEENKIMQEAYQKIAACNLDETAVIVLDADTWHHGVIGIVSSRITEKYCRPSILISFEGNEGTEHSPDDVGKGSGRSIKGMNLVDALCYCSDHLVKFGGHELAAGLSVTRGELPAFKQKINEYAKSSLCEKDMIPTVEADLEISFSDIGFDLAEKLQILEPYGVGNPVPCFVVRGVVISELSSVSDGKHTRLSFTDGKNAVSAMYFSAAPSSLGVGVGDIADVLFNLDINEYMGRRSVQLIVRDLKRSETQNDVDERARSRFNEIANGATFTAEENVLPSREDFSAVYRSILAAHRAGIEGLSHRDICSRVAHGPDRREIGYIKLKFIIKIFHEMNIIGIEEPTEEFYRFRFRYSTTKTDLEKSGLLRRLRSQQKG